MADVTNIPTGLGVPTQIPLDTIAFNQSESLLSNLGTDNFLAFKYYEGLVVHCINEKSTYIWREVETGEENTGLISLDFTYPNNHIVYNIDYSNRTFNFFPYFRNYDVQNVGNGEGIYKDNTLTGLINTFNFKSLTSANNSISITDNGDTIDFELDSETIDTNFAKNNLIFTGNRVHDLKNHTIHYTNAKQIKSTVNSAQITGEASIEEKGFGSAVTDIIKRIYNGVSSLILEIRGDKSVRFYGNVWSNGPSNSIDNNTAFGQNALLNNVLGLRNTAFGYRSLENSTNNDNTAFGNQSLLNLTTGQLNTAIGMEAGFSIETGVQNTLLGYGAMNLSENDSSFNTVVGFASLTRTVDEVFITESNRCTVLGNDIKVNSGNLTPFNQIIIGDVARGEGDNTAVIGSIDTEVLYIPRHTTTEINSFIGMSTGALVFNTTLNTLCFYNGTTWQKVTSTNM